MQRRSRIRRIAKWTGLAVCVMLVVAWGVTQMWQIQYARLLGERSVVDITDGVIFIFLGTAEHDAFPATGVKLNRRTGRRPYRYGFMLPHINPWGPKLTMIMVPLWVLFVPVTAVTAVAWWRDRRHPPGHCQRCGYDLTGNESGVCPECGNAI